MTTQEVANRLVDLCRKGKHEQAIKEFYAPDIVSIEPEGYPNRIARGLKEVAEKSRKFEERLEAIHSSTVSDPIVAENYFSCNMLMNVSMKGIPAPFDMDEICVYNVKEGKIVREEFFYTLPPNQE